MDYTKSGNNIKIIPYLKDPYEGGSANTGKTFTASINPESVKHTRAINVNQEDVSNTAFDVFQFKGYGKETVVFSIVIDGTKFINDSDGEVKTQINKLLECVYNYQSSSHKAHFLKIEWAQNFHEFYCHCESLDVNYTLFDTTGKALIAEVDLNFVVHRNKKKLMKQTTPQSPDMTHIHTFKDGDNLLALCQDIYDDTSYYMQIAEMNNLTNFREIPIGKQIFFPPLVNKD